MNLNDIGIPTDGIYDQPLENNFIHQHGVQMCVYFRDLEHVLCEHIKNAQIVVGCVAWLTNDKILDTLAGVQEGVAIVVQKEDFLRPESRDVKWKENLHKKYSRLPTGPQRNFYPGILGSMTQCGDGTVQPVRCVGNHNRDRKPAFPRMHNKFLVFCVLRDDHIVDEDGYVEIINNRIIPYAVWTGSFNLTKNATQSFENAVYIQDDAVAESYFNEFQQIMALSEPLDWEDDWCEPEWRIGS